MSSEQNFSFLELNTLISKQYIHTDKEPRLSDRPRLKFEPNLNVKRKMSSSIERKDKEGDNKTDIINDITKNFEGEISLIKKPQKELHQAKPSYNKDNQNQKYQVPIEVTLKKEKAKKQTSDFGLANAINAIKSKDPTAYVPIILPFKESSSSEEKQINSTKDIIMTNNEIEEDDLYLLQFPRQIPIDIPLQEKEKYEEASTEEPQYDSKGYLIKPEFQNVFKELPKNTPLGKLKIYKSGKVKMQIGEVLFDIVPGINTKFAQEISVITNEESNQAYLLGKINQRKLIAVPELD